MTSSSRLAAVCVALVAGSTATQVLAQPFPSVDTGRILAPAGQDQDVIRWTAGANVLRHSNVFRLADGVSAVGLFGKEQRSDTVLSGNVGVALDREISLQRLRLDLTLNPTAYKTYTKLNSLGYLGQAKLDWAIGSAFYGDFGTRLSQVQTSFVGTTYGGDINLERRNLLFFTGGVRMTPSWSVFGRVDRETLDNSLGQSFIQAANYTATAAEGGVRFEPGSGTEFSVLGRRTKAEYPNLQDRDYLGNPIAVPISNNYKQNALLARLLLRPNEDTAIAGTLGYTRRDYDAVPSRDFSGPTARLSMDWRPGPGFFMSTEVYRDLASAAILTANYVDVIGIRLRPTFVLTGKISLVGSLTYENIDWKGDPGLIASTSAIRKDTMTYAGLQLVYDYSRLLSLTADLRRENRSSNYTPFVFSNNIMGVGIQARF